MTPPPAKDPTERVPEAVRVVGTLWVLGVLAALGLAWQRVWATDAAFARSLPVERAAPFPVPRRPFHTAAVGGAPECQKPCTDCVTTSRGGTTARLARDGLLCVSHDGQTHWSFRSESPPDARVSTVTVSENAVVLAAATGTLYALSPEDGAPRWAVHLGERFVGAPEAQSGAIRVGVESEGALSLVTLDTTTGELTPRR